jgi:hypothetical protein
MKLSLAMLDSLLEFPPQFLLEVFYFPSFLFGLLSLLYVGWIL